MDTSRLHEAPLGSLLVLSGRLAQQRWGNYLATHHNLTPAGVAVLTVLDANGDLGHRELAERCFFKPATLTGIVDTLEKSGHVRRQPDPADRRAIRLVITESGQAAIAKVQEVRTLTQPLTSVDADPAKAAIVRQFLMELISTMEDPRELTSS
ncbi:MarR family winged helix-turn-helix transcriptional regulator [Catenuloplanes sp. NPDC051500]|uniref:MarR family winged helix-turn-helix transcriptional regulator n=1 Tax=Catenuloplanes sp. NPDC051500 TaxID=3363959 RepID=UPI00378923BD